MMGMIENLKEWLEMIWGMMGNGLMNDGKY